MAMPVFMHICNAHVLWDTGLLRQGAYVSYHSMPEIWPHVLLQGDNDPADVVEISGSPLESGGVYHVKFLGAYAMIDGGELDWKILCIDVDSPLAAKMDTIEDVERCDSGSILHLKGCFYTGAVTAGTSAAAVQDLTGPCLKDFTSG